MSIFDWILFVLAIIFLIAICIYFVVVEIKSSVFNPQGFVGNKKDLYNVTFEKFDFDYSIVSGTDNNKNQENLIGNAVEQIDTKNKPTIKEVDYYA